MLVSLSLSHAPLRRNKENPLQVSLQLINDDYSKIFLVAENKKTHERKMMTARSDFTRE